MAVSAIFPLEVMRNSYVVPHPYLSCKLHIASCPVLVFFCSLFRFIKQYGDALSCNLQLVFRLLPVLSFHTITNNILISVCIFWVSCQFLSPIQFCPFL